jgi:hypothetical protein
MKKETPEAVGQDQAQPMPEPTRHNVAEMTLMEQISWLNKAHEIIHAAEKEIATQLPTNGAKRCRIGIR